VGCCEHGIEISAAIKGGAFTDQLIDYQLLKEVGRRKYFIDCMQLVKICEVSLQNMIILIPFSRNF
jgi:hypothetical protein